MNLKLKEIAEHYGYDAQSRQLIEEMAELTQAINKFWRKRSGKGLVPESTQELLSICLCQNTIKYHPKWLMCISYWSRLDTFSILMIQNCNKI